MAPQKHQSAAGLPFATADEAAIAAIDEINPRSIQEGIEYAGRIYFIPSRNVFRFFRPNRGDRDGIHSDAGSALTRIQAGGKIINAQNVGTYHTHAGLSTSVWMPDQETWSSEIFSLEDLFKARFANKLSGEYAWLGTPYQRILKFTPPYALPDSDPDKPKGKVEVLRNVWVLPGVTITGSPSAP